VAAQGKQTQKSRQNCFRIRLGRVGNSLCWALPRIKYNIELLELLGGAGISPWRCSLWPFGCDTDAGGQVSAPEKGPALIPLTVPEVRRLLLRVVPGQLSPAERALVGMATAHQTWIRASHCRRRGADSPEQLWL
jgi:hypothetical protein